MSDKRILSLDFDGVCHSYTSPWQGPTVIPDPPVAGLYDFLQRADRFFITQIYSTRSETPEGRRAMSLWFEKHMPNETYRPAIGRLQFPDHKPKAFVGLDDRILTFEGIWPMPADLLSWKPWNKRGITPYTPSASVLEIPEKYLGPLRRVLQQDIRAEKGPDWEALEYLRAELRHA